VIRFEIRSVSDRVSRAEIVYRRMAVALESGDCARVRSESARLLELHPFSSAVHQAWAECAERAGRNREAVAEYDRARELLVRGQMPTESWARPKPKTFTMPLPVSAMLDWV
jgi:DNA-binding SARP family transcriptional activator